MVSSGLKQPRLFPTEKLRSTAIADGIKAVKRRRARIATDENFEI